MNSPENITVLNKDGQKSCIFKPKGDSVYELIVLSSYAKYLGHPIEADQDGFMQIDMLGGPLLEVGKTLNSYHEDLPEKEILSITSDLNGTTITYAL